MVQIQSGTGVWIQWLAEGSVKLAERFVVTAGTGNQSSISDSVDFL